MEAVDSEHRKLVVRFDDFQSAAVATATQKVALVGGAGVLLTSNDNGANWHRSSLSSAGSKANFIDVTSCPNGSFAGLELNKNVWVEDSATGVWKPYSVDTEEDLLAIACDLENKIWVVGAFASILVSPDKGNNWDAGHSLDDDYILTNIQFLEGGNAFIAGEFGKFLSSQDGGRSWQAIDSLPKEFYPLSMYFSGAQSGWVGGLEGVIFHTTDGGDNWSREPTSTDAPIYRIDGNDESVYSVGNNGALLKRERNEWKNVQLATRPLSYLRAISFLDGGSSLLVAGGSGTMQIIGTSEPSAPNL